MTLGNDTGEDHSKAKGRASARGLMQMGLINSSISLNLDP